MLLAKHFEGCRVTIHGCTLSPPPFYMYHALLRTVIRTSIRIKLRAFTSNWREFEHESGKWIIHFPDSRSNSRSLSRSLSSSDGSNSFLSCWLTPPVLRNSTKDESIIIFRHAWVVGELEREREYSQNGNGNESQERERVMRMSLSVNLLLRAYLSSGLVCLFSACQLVLYRWQYPFRAWSHGSGLQITSLPHENMCISGDLAPFRGSTLPTGEWDKPIYVLLLRIVTFFLQCDCSKACEIISAMILIEFNSWSFWI